MIRVPVHGLGYGAKGSLSNWALSANWRHPLPRQVTVAPLSSKASMLCP